MSRRPQARLGVKDGNGVLAQVMKTVHTSHGGKLSISRILSGTVVDGLELDSSNGRSGKVSGIYRMLGKDQSKLASAKAGETVALGKLDDVRTGETLGSGKGARCRAGQHWRRREPVFSIALRPKERKDEVKMSAALQRLAEEDPSMILQHQQDSSETLLSGHGEMHLRVIIERLEGTQPDPGRAPCAGRSLSRDDPQDASPSAAATRSSRAATASSATWSSTSSRCRAARASSSPKRSPAASCPGSTSSRSRSGVRDYLKTGPLGFPVVDLAVNLVEGSYHSVDSSDMAFQMAAKIAMKEGMAACSPVLLEPIMKVEIFTPSDATAKVDGASCRSGAARSSATTRGPAGRAGTSSRRRCRSPRSAT